MTVGEVALTVVAAVFVIFAIFGIITMLKIGKTMDVARDAIASTQQDSRPVLRKADTTLGLVNTNLSNLTGVTGAAKAISGNASGLISLVSATLGGPVVRAASFTYGVRRALLARSARAARKSAVATAKSAGKRVR
jgi:hypothetical protein